MFFRAERAASSLARVAATRGGLHGALVGQYSRRVPSAGRGDVSGRLQAAERPAVRSHTALHQGGDAQWPTAVAALFRVKPRAVTGRCTQVRPVGARREDPGRTKGGPGAEGRGRFGWTVARGMWALVSPPQGRHLAALCPLACPLIAARWVRDLGGLKPPNRAVDDKEAWCLCMFCDIPCRFSLVMLCES